MKVWRLPVAEPQGRGRALINMLPLDGRAKQIVRIIVIVIGVLSLLRYLAVF